MNKKIPFKQLSLSDKQKDELWGVTGPYSEVMLAIENRILDDSISRIFINIDVHINPLTYKIIKQNRKKFKNNLEIQSMLDYSEYRGLKFGYVSCAFHAEYRNESIMKLARKRIKEVNKTVIKMHKFVMRLLS